MLGARSGDMVRTSRVFLVCDQEDEKDEEEEVKDDEDDGIGSDDLILSC
jgi:hypothetical protein